MIYKKIIAYSIIFSLTLTPMKVDAAFEDISPRSIKVSPFSTASLLCGIVLVVLGGLGKKYVSQKIKDGKEKLFDLDLPTPSATKPIKDRASLEQEMRRWRRFYALSTMSSWVGLIGIGMGLAVIFHDISKNEEEDFQKSIRSVPRGPFGALRHIDVPKIPASSYQGEAQDFVEYFNTLQDAYRVHKKKIKRPFSLEDTDYYYRPREYKDWMYNGHLLEIISSYPMPEFDNVLYLRPEDLKVTDNRLGNVALGKISRFRHKCFNYMVNCFLAWRAAYKRAHGGEFVYNFEREALNFAMAHNDLDRIFYSEVMRGLDEVRNRWREVSIKKKLGAVEDESVHKIINLLDLVHTRAQTVLENELRASNATHSSSNQVNNINVSYPHVEDSEKSRYERLLAKNKEVLEKLAQEVGNTAINCVKEMFEQEVTGWGSFEYLQWAYHKDSPRFTFTYRRTMTTQEWVTAGWKDIVLPPDLTNQEG